MSYYTNDFGVNYASKRISPDEVRTILAEAYDLGVDKVVSISNNIAEARRNIAMAKKQPRFHYVIGCHPHNAKSFMYKDIAFLEENLGGSACWGIGECGLDFNRDFSPRDVQARVFRTQVQIAKKHQKPMYIHCRDAYTELIEILLEEDYHCGLIHCFTGDLDQALYFCERGFKLGITGYITNKSRSKATREAIKSPKIALTDLITETDAPWMVVKPKTREGGSRPEDTSSIVQTIAQLKGLDEIECGKALYDNSNTFLAPEIDLL